MAQKSSGSGWKSMTIESEEGLTSEDFAGLVGIEELHDYEMINRGDGLKMVQYKDTTTKVEVVPKKKKRIETEELILDALQPKKKLKKMEIAAEDKKELKPKKKKQKKQNENKEQKIEGLIFKIFSFYS